MALWYVSDGEMFPRDQINDGKTHGVHLGVKGLWAIKSLEWTRVWVLLIDIFYIDNMIGVCVYFKVDICEVCDIHTIY